MKRLIVDEITFEHNLDMVIEDKVSATIKYEKLNSLANMILSILWFIAGLIQIVEIFSHSNSTVGIQLLIFVGIIHLLLRK